MSRFMDQNVFKCYQKSKTSNCIRILQSGRRGFCRRECEIHKGGIREKGEFHFLFIKMIEIHRGNRYLPKFTALPRKQGGLSTLWVQGEFYIYRYFWEKTVDKSFVSVEIN